MVEGNEARQLDERPAVEQRHQLVLALPGELHRVAFASLPLPGRASETERETLVRHVHIAVHEVLLYCARRPSSRIRANTMWWPHQSSVRKVNFTSPSKCLK